jgi:hypothetical protein
VSDTPPWPLGTTLYHYTTVDERYEPIVLGRVVRVGKLGVTVELAEPDQHGERELRLTLETPI